MEHDIGTFLRSRRARIAPQALGLPIDGRRRVPGLRREELAQAAGVSVDYYVRLEQGRTANVSDSVLDAVARVLGLGDVEREHLRTLARGPVLSAATTGDDGGEQRLAPGLSSLLEAMDTVPAFVLGRRTDVLAWNALADAVFGFDALKPVARNSAWFTFMHPDAHELYAEWELVAAETVAFLALDAGRHPSDPKLERLVGELAIASETFRALWGRNDVGKRSSGEKRLRHRIAGDLDLHFMTFVTPGHQDQVMVTLSAEPGSPSRDRLRMLAELTAVTAPHDAPVGARPVQAPGDRA